VTIPNCQLQQTSSSKPFGSIPLKDAKVGTIDSTKITGIPEAPHIFCIVAGGAGYYLHAVTAEDRQSWIASLLGLPGLNITSIDANTAPPKPKKKKKKGSLFASPVLTNCLTRIVAADGAAPKKRTTKKDLTKAAPADGAADIPPELPELPGGGEEQPKTRERSRSVGGATPKKMKKKVKAVVSPPPPLDLAAVPPTLGNPADAGTPDSPAVEEAEAEAVEEVVEEAPQPKPQIVLVSKRPPARPLPSLPPPGPPAASLPTPAATASSPRAEPPKLPGPEIPRPRGRSQTDVRISSITI